MPDLPPCGSGLSVLPDAIPFRPRSYPVIDPTYTHGNASPCLQLKPIQRYIRAGSAETKQETQNTVPRYEANTRNHLCLRDTPTSGSKGAEARKSDNEDQGPDKLRVVDPSRRREQRSTGYQSSIFSVVLFREAIYQKPGPRIGWNASDGRSGSGIGFLLRK